MNITKHIKPCRIAILSLAFCSVFSILSCSEDLPLYQDSAARLNFDLGDDNITSESRIPVEAYSFVYSGGLHQDTIWAKVTLMGKPSDKDRTFSIAQVMAKTDSTGVENCNAVAGKHFIALDDPSLSRYYVLKADSVSATFPVVVLRDASLASQVYKLYIGITENSEFQSGFPFYQVKRITISDMLAKPSKWDERYINQYFTDWGPVAHQFMIDVTGQPFDDDFIEKIMSSSDTNYVFYLAEKVARAKVKYNKEHPDAPLTEADGTLITFKWEAYL